MERIIGVIGGSGLYQIGGLEDAKWVRVDTPWGPPSDELFTGRLDGVKIVFLPRHGRGHVHSPSSVPYRANIDAMKRLGVTDLVSLSATGSFRETMAPGDFVIVDQFEAAEGVTVHMGGTYLAMEGPQFSTLAESRMYRDSWGADVIGMTNMPEAKLAREAELCYASVAMVTDYDSWHPGHGEVDVTGIIATLTANSAAARKLIANLPRALGTTHDLCRHGCDRALTHAVMTAPDQRDARVVAKLDAIGARVL